MLPQNVLCPLLMKSANPKSITFILPSVSTKMFSNLRSLCAINLAWQCPIADTICEKYFFITSMDRTENDVFLYSNHPAAPTLSAFCGFGEDIFFVSYVV